MTKPLIRWFALSMFLMCFQLTVRACIMQDSVNNYGSNIKKGHYAQVHGIRLYYEIYGKGELLLLIHGGLGSIQDFEKNIPELAKHFKVIAVDSRGYGRSSNPSDSMSYELLTDDIKQLLDTLKLDQVNVCGFSDGGIVALYLAAKYPDKVKRVFASGANYLATGPNPTQSDDSLFIHYLKTNPFWVRFHKQYNRLNPNPKRFFKQMILVRGMWHHNPCIPSSLYRSIRKPVFLLYGDHDLIPLEQAVQMYRLLPPKTTRLCILPETDHYTFSLQSKWVNTLVIHFFEEDL